MEKNTVVALGNTGTASNLVLPLQRDIFEDVWTFILPHKHLYKALKLLTGADHGNKMTRLGSPS